MINLLAKDSNGREIELQLKEIISVDGRPFNPDAMPEPTLQELRMELTLLKHTVFGMAMQMGFIEEVPESERSAPSQEINRCPVPPA